MSSMGESILELLERPPRDGQLGEHLGRLLLDHGNVEQDRLVVRLEVQRLLRVPQRELHGGEVAVPVCLRVPCSGKVERRGPVHSVVEPLKGRLVLTAVNGRGQIQTSL